MKQIYRLIFAFGAIFSIFSCNKEQLNNENIQSGNFKEVKFECEYPETKATVDDNGNVAWEQGDQLTLYYIVGGEVKSATATVDAAGSASTITAQIPTGDDPEDFYAVYPADRGSLSTDGVFTVNTNFVSDGTFKQANVAAAYSTATEKKFSFKPATGLVKVQLPENAVVMNGGTPVAIGGVEISGKETGATDSLCVGKVSAIVKTGKVIGFGEVSSAVNTLKANVSAAAKTAGYVYLQTVSGGAEKGFGLRFLDVDGNAIPGVKVKKAVEIYRGEILPVLGAAENIVFDWYFSPDGSGDGRSAATPANTANLVTLAGNTAAVSGQWRLAGTTIHLADGTYIPAAPINFQGAESGTLTIEGTSMKGTVIDGTATAALATPVATINFTSAMNLNISKLTIQNSKSNKNGGGMTYSGGVLVMDSCYFYKNEALKGNSGGIYLAGTGRTIRNSTFEENTASTFGGAFSLAGTATGTTTIENCSFKKNVLTGTKNGGAFYAANTTLTTVNNCVFDENSGYQAGAIYADKAGAAIYVNASLFVGNAVTKSGYNANGGAIMIKSNSAKLGVYNCTFNYNHASASSSSSSALNADQYVIANCTFVESAKMSYGVITSYATAEHKATLANNIILTTSTTATHPSVSAGGNSATTAYNFLDSRNNLYTRLLANFTTAAADATSKVGCTKTTFGFGDSVDKENKCYAWSGDVSAIEGYAKCNLSDVENLIKANTALGNDFWAWLESINATNVDVRGVSRTNPIWPGSYQAATE